MADPTQARSRALVPINVFINTSMTKLGSEEPSKLFNVRYSKILPQVMTSKLAPTTE